MRMSAYEQNPLGEPRGRLRKVNRLSHCYLKQVLVASFVFLKRAVVEIAASLRAEWSDSGQVTTPCMRRNMRAHTNVVLEHTAWDGPEV